MRGNRRIDQHLVRAMWAAFGPQELHNNSRHFGPAESPAMPMRI